MREQTPEQLSIFDILPDMEKPEDFFLPDSFDVNKRGAEAKGKAFEKVRYIGNGTVSSGSYTIYVRKYTDSNGNGGKYIVSVPTIDFTFGYNSLTKLLSEWDIKEEDLVPSEKPHDSL